MAALLATVLLLALLLPRAPAITTTVRSIPSTEGNQAFFALSQSLIANGVRRISSCGPDLPEIERCIRVCNAPGLAERSGCCCVAKTDDFTVGLRGGCRYSQRVQNFTTRFIYKSSPITRRPFFGPNSCERTRRTGTGGPCTCSIQWEANTDFLEMVTPLPTPSVSPTPVLTSTPSPVPSTSPVLTPEPSATLEPTAEETTTPTPDSELFPTGPTLPSPSPPDGFPTETDGDLLPTDDEGDMLETPADDMMDSPAPGISPGVSPGATDDAEQQAAEDDGTICVDERYLLDRGFGAEALVHTHGVMANVLCPAGRSLPCGTADHKVRFAGEDMSYEYLCARTDVQCRAARMKVNSVYTHLWTDVAHEDILLTMFDVRYSETAQMALHAVMRGWRSFKNRMLV